MIFFSMKSIIQSASSSATIDSSLSSDENIVEQQEPKSNQHRLTRHASARRLFEVNEWDEQQKRLKQKLKTVKYEQKKISYLIIKCLQGESNTNYSYNEIKSTTQELLKVNNLFFFQFFILKRPNVV